LQVILIFYFEFCHFYFHFIHSIFILKKSKKQTKKIDWLCMRFCESPHKQMIEFIKRVDKIGAQN